MVTKITFEKESSGYLGDKKYKKVPATEENRKKAVPGRRSYEKEGLVRIEDGYKCSLARECLLGKTFTFDKDRINILFGPNACGKSTILSSIAISCFCGDHSNYILDGWTNAFKYGSIDFFSFDEVNNFKETLEKELKAELNNDLSVEWDGCPVYYDKFTDRRGNSIGDLQGTLLRDTVEEVGFILNRSRISQGQMKIFILSKLFGLVKEPMTIDKVLAIGQSKLGKNPSELNQRVYDVQREYLLNHYTGEHTCNTILLDEIDSHLDINNSLVLFKEIFPGVVGNGIQIIAVSHSPLVLLKGIYDSEKYNIISLSPEYTEKCRESMKELL